MNLSPRDRRAVLLGAIGLAIILVVRFGVAPWADDWAAARERIEADRLQLGALQGNISRVLGQRSRLGKLYGPGVNRPPADMEAARVGLLKAAQQVLRANGFQPSGYRPQPPRALPDVPGVMLVTLQVVGKCKEPSLPACLAALRQAEMLLLVDKLSVTNDAKKPGELQVTWTLATLALPPKEPS